MVSVKIFWCCLRSFWSLLSRTRGTEQRLKDEVDCSAVGGVWYALSETAGVNSWSYVPSRKERANGGSDDLWTFKSKFGLEDVWAVSWCCMWESWSRLKLKGWWYRRGSALETYWIIAPKWLDVVILYWYFFGCVSFRSFPFFYWFFLSSVSSNMFWGYCS